MPPKETETEDRESGAHPVGRSAREREGSRVDAYLAVPVEDDHEEDDDEGDYQVRLMSSPA